MTIDTNAIVTATEANQNFSKVAKLAEKKGGSRYVVSPWALTWDDENYYLIAFDEAAERNLGPNGHPELPDGKYEGGRSKRELEEEDRLGCPCGAAMTTHRLRRQWNLSQTDWEGRLLPVRYAYTSSSAMDTGAVPARMRSEWEPAAQPPPSGQTANLEGLMQTLMASPWYRFDSDEKESADSILPIGEDDSADSWLLFLKKRKIL